MKKSMVSNVDLLGNSSGQRGDGLTLLGFATFCNNIEDVEIFISASADCYHFVSAGDDMTFLQQKRKSLHVLLHFSPRTDWLPDMLGTNLQFSCFCFGRINKKSLWRHNHLAKLARCSFEQRQFWLQVVLQLPLLVFFASSSNCPQSGQSCVKSCRYHSLWLARCFVWLELVSLCTKSCISK